MCIFLSKNAARRLPYANGLDRETLSCFERTRIGEHPEQDTLGCGGRVKHLPLDFHSSPKGKRQDTDDTMVR